MKIEVGRFYKTRDGRKAEIIEDDGSNEWPILASYTDYLQLWCSRNGITNLDDREDDLIAEWTDDPEVGTLQEIGAKVGDVVSGEDGTYFVCDGENGYGQVGLWACKSDDGEWRKGWASRVGGWRIISRAQPKPEQTGPVRTVTRTTREIVPGVYGTLQVHACGDYTINESTADELTAAIAALTAIRDALKENGE